MTQEELPTSHSHVALPLSSGVPPQEGVRTTLERVVRFLEKDNDYVRKIVQNELEAKKQAEGTFNALIVVAAFVAGVQSQVLSNTFDKNDTTLQIVTNGFGFFGLVLDILGSGFATLYALELRKVSQQAPELLRLWEERQKAAIEKLAEDVGKVTNTPADGENVTARQSLLRELLQRRWFWAARRFSRDTLVDIPLRRHVEVLFHSDPGHFWLVASMLLGAQSITPCPILMSVRLTYIYGGLIIHRGEVPNVLDFLGADPLWLISAGIACLLVSVLCLAAYSQKLGVWLPCVLFAGISAFSMFSSWCIQFAGRISLRRSVRNVSDATAEEQVITQKALELLRSRTIFSKTVP